MDYGGIHVLHIFNLVSASHLVSDLMSTHICLKYLKIELSFYSRASGTEKGVILYT